MAESDFNDLINSAEQLASEIDGVGDLPRVERTLRQVLEASQDLWTRVTSNGAQEIQANLLLGSKGVDLPQLSQKLESLSSKRTFEPLEPIPDTDIESFLKNETENAILSLIDSTHSDTFERLRVDHKDSIKNEWELEKMKLMSSMVGKDGKEFLDISYPHEKTVLNDSVMGTRSFLSPDEMRYVKATMEYHKIIIDGDPKPNLVERFSQVCMNYNDQMVNEMWAIVKYMIQIPPQIKGSPVDVRKSTTVQTKLLSQARSYLENRYRTYMNSVVQNSLREAQRGGHPGTYTLVRSFVGLRIPNYVHQEYIEVDGRPLWPMVYYYLRCGDASSAYKCIQNVGPTFQEILTAIEDVKNSDQSLPSVISEKAVSQVYYRHGIKNDPDPYKRVVYCILGMCNISENHSEVIKTADDYLWLKLTQVRIDMDEETRARTGSEHLNYFKLQSFVAEEYEGHRNVNEQPHIYFQLLFLTGQWEAAIDFLMRNDKLRVHGVHIAIALNDLDLLALPNDVKSPLLIFDERDPKPMYRLNLTRLIMIYVHKFENQDLLEALHYYFCLRSLKTLDNMSVFGECVSDLVMKTRQFETILGRLEFDGCRSPGLIDQFRGSVIDVDLVINRVAETAEITGQYEDAIKLYDLAGKHENVLRLISTLLSQVVSRVNCEPGSLRYRLAAYAENITRRYAGIQLQCDRATQATFYTLRDLLTFFDYYAQKKYQEALDIIQRSRLIPFSADEIDERIRNFQSLNEGVSRNIPDILLATMNMLYAQYTKIKGDAHNSSRTYFADSLKEQLSYLRERAKTITSFAGTVPYRMPGDTNSRLVQMEILMH